MRANSFTPRRRSLRVALALGLASVLTLAGCSGGGDQGGGESGETVKIGLPHPLTGAWSDGGQNAVNGAMLAIEDINEAGGLEGLDGAMLEGVEADTGSTDPGQAATVTRQLIERDEVSALVGSYVSGFTTTASTEAEKAGVPMISQSYSDELSDRGYQYFFQLPPTASALGSTVVPYVQEAYAAVGIDIKRVAVLASNDASIQGQGEAAIQQSQDAGLEVVYDNFYPQDLSDATVMVQATLDAEPDAIFLGGPTGAAVAIIQAIRSLGFDGPIVGLGGGGILTPQFGELLGDDVNGILSQAAWNWDLPFEGLEDVAAEYSERFDSTFMPQEAGESYVAVWVLAEAMNSAGSADAEAIAEVLRSTEFDSGHAAQMPGGTVKFDDIGLNEKVFPIMIQWQEGTTRTVWPQDVQVVEPQ